MAYVYLDDDAVPLVTSDGAHASAAATQLRDNVEALSQERRQLASWGGVLGSPGRPRLCSVSPAAWGPWWIYLHPSERAEQLLVRVSMQNIDWSEGDTVSASTTAIDVAVTAGNAAGEVQQPPARRDEESSADPVAARKWYRYVTDTTPDDITFDVRLSDVRRARLDDPSTGWIAVYLWTWSWILETAEATADYVSGADQLGRIEVENESGLGSFSLRPERAVSLRDIIYSAGKGAETAEPGGALYQLAHREDTTLTPAGTEDIYWLMPPLRHSLNPIMTSVPQIRIYTMGVAELQGLSIEHVPDEVAPRARDLHTDEPIGESTYVPLADRLDRLVANRTPQWMCRPWLHKDDFDWADEDYEFWRVVSEFSRANGATGEAIAEGTSGSPPGSPTVLLAAPMPVGLPSGDGNGHRAMLSVYVSRVHSRPLPFYFRLSVLDLDYSSIVDGAWEAVTLRASERFPGGKPMLATNAWGGIVHRYWQFRGALFGTEGQIARAAPAEVLALGGDFGFVHHIPLELPETSITYPSLIRVECYTDSTLSIDLVSGEQLELVALGLGIVASGMDD